MYCVKCGSVLAEGAAFCRVCGNPVSASPRPAEAVSSAVPLGSPVAPPLGAYIPPAGSVNPSLMAPYAGFWLRAVAHLIDSAILAVAFGAVIAICLASFGARFFRGFAPGAYDRPNVSYQFTYNYTYHPFFPAAVLGIILLLLPVMITGTWLYFALLEASVHQGTVGKIAMGLFVTDLQGRRIGFGRASGRFFAKFVTQLIPLGIGYMMAGFTEKKQALHDMIAGCLVLKKI